MTKDRQYFVEAILQKRTNTDGETEYLVRWEGQWEEEEQKTWLPAKDINTELIAQWEEDDAALEAAAESEGEEVDEDVEQASVSIPQRSSESTNPRNLNADNNRTAELDDSEPRGAAATSEQVEGNDAGSEADAKWVVDEDFTENSRPHQAGQNDGAADQLQEPFRGLADEEIDAVVNSFTNEEIDAVLGWDLN